VVNISSNNSTVVISAANTSVVMNANPSDW